MSSSLLVRCAKVDTVDEHPDADRLLIVKVFGWRCIVRKVSDEDKAAGKHDPRPGDFIVYIPPDSILPEDLALQLNVKNYLKPGNIVHKIRLRGIMSYGLLIPNIWNFKEGEEVSEVLGITKYIEPKLSETEDWLPEHPFFPKYRSIENYNNFPNVFSAQDQIIATEKIHGVNSRVGLVRDRDGESYEYMIGSHDERFGIRADDDEKKSLYQLPFDERMRCALNAIADYYNAQSVVFYGEIYGVQDLRYGLKDKGYDYRAFDLFVDGDFLSYSEFSDWCQKFNIKTVPLVYHGLFDFETLKTIVEGRTTLMTEKPHMIEGVVFKPVMEKVAPELGRVILKLKGDQYEGRSKATEYR
jgi:RNA ligase (TIGR02306 family)